MEWLAKRKQRAKRDGNIKQLAEATNALGDLYFEEGRLEEALQEYMEELDAYTALGDRLNCAVARRMIGEVHASLGDYQQALEYQEMYLEGAEEMNDKLEVQRAFATLGRTYFCLAESLREGSDERKKALSSAKKAYSRSIVICAELKNISEKEKVTMRARLLLNLGLVCEAQMKLDQGVDLIKKATGICQIHNLSEDLHRCQLALAAIHERQGKNELALECVDLAAKIDIPSMRVEARLAKAELILRMGDWIEARKILVNLYKTKNLPQPSRPQIEKLLRIAVTLCRGEDSLITESNTQARRKLYESLGDAAVAARNYTKALDYYSQMLLWAEKGGGEGEDAALNSLAQTLRDAGRCEEALTFAKRELKLCSDPREACRSALFVAELLEATESSVTQIQESYDLALSKAKACGDVFLEVSVLRDLLNYLEKTGSSEEAEKVQKNLDSLSEMITESDSEKESESQDIGADICLDQLSDVETLDNANEQENNSRIARRGRRAPVIKKNEKGETQLHVACINGIVENVEKLLSAGHSTSVRDHCGWTPLHEAANHGHTEIVKLLLDAGADINDPGGPQCGGITPLHDAATCGHFSVINLLIKRGANVLVTMKDGNTVLDCLEGWRKRVENLSSSDQSEYTHIHQKLLSLLPSTSSRRQRKSTDSWENWTSLVDEETGKDDNAFVENISAGEDYKRTIACLRNRGGSLVPSRNIETLPKSTAPLLDSEQILQEEWLDDDVGPVAKRQTNITDDQPSTAKRKSSNSTPIRERSSKRQRINSDNDLQPIDIYDAESSGSNCSEISDQPVRKVKRVKQSSLLGAGFSRSAVSRTPSPILTQLSQSSTSHPTQLEIVNLQVWVEEKLFHLKLTTKEQKKTTAATIIDRIKKKFEEDTGCIPQLNLMTLAGGAISIDSTLEAILPSGSSLVLKSEVVEMVVPPISERYSTICRTYKIDVQDAMTRCLKACENTSTFRLKERDTSDEELEPLLKSLEHQYSLQVLYLSGGILYSLGETLNRCLRRLTSLQELHLRCCDIDSDSLAKIDELPAQLRVLDLSCNPLGPDCEEKLCSLISPLKCLQTLNVSSCMLETVQPGIHNTVLANLDLSSNSLGGEGVSALLQSRMLTLNLSNTHSPGKSPIVRTLLDRTNLRTLECLELAFCDLSHSELLEILSHSPNLTRLVVSDNKKLSKLSVISLLEHKPTLLYIGIGGCTIIDEPPGQEVVIDHPELCTLVVSMVYEVQTSWLRLWRGRAVAMSLGYHVVIIKPDL